MIKHFQDFQNPPQLFAWWFGTFSIFPYIGNFIIPTDELIFFQRGRLKPPTSNLYKIFHTPFKASSQDVRDDAIFFHIYSWC